MPTFTLIAWPMVALVFFLVLGRQRGLIWSVVVGYLFLPEVWTLDIQGLPSYAKAEAIALGLVLGVTLTQSDAGPPPKADPFAKRMFNIILVLLFLSSFLTMLTNRDPVFIGDNGFVLPGIGLWELQNRIVGLLVALTPFFLA